MKIRFQVEDTGIGIGAEQVSKIFLPYLKKSSEVSPVLDGKF
ncbi:hypothetical protein PL11201_550072 [Planktothrix sp. PCC 11201]|nr:hypothetical protein [Planktothrix sp. PCC 11201]SKB13952.1 hypothetical protein PL11201_550072 [Planktothrix sp. PCC 11201]